MSAAARQHPHQQASKPSALMPKSLHKAPEDAASQTAAAAAAAAPAASAPAPKAKQPSLATLMMLKRRIGDLRARHKRNRPVRRLENSYRLGPEPVGKYPAGEVRLIVENSLKFFLGESRYDPRASPKLAKMVTEDVKRRMKNNFSCPRYKIVVMVTVTQRAQQHVMMASRTAADSELDDFVTCTMERPTFLASAAVFWFYCE